MNYLKVMLSPFVWLQIANLVFLVVMPVLIVRPIRPEPDHRKPFGVYVIYAYTAIVFILFPIAVIAYTAWMVPNLSEVLLSEWRSMAFVKSLRAFGHPLVWVAGVGFLYYQRRAAIVCFAVHAIVPLAGYLNPINLMAGTANFLPYLILFLLKVGPSLMVLLYTLKLYRNGLLNGRVTVLGRAP